MPATDTIDFEREFAELVNELQALPTDGKAVMVWENLDAALDNVARGIRAAVESMLARSET